MKEKTKRGLIICGATAVCAAMMCVIGMQFTKDDEPIQTAKLPEQTNPAVTVAISTTAKTESEPIEAEDENDAPELNEDSPEETGNTTGLSRADNYCCNNAAPSSRDNR